MRRGGGERRCDPTHAGHRGVVDRHQRGGIRYARGADPGEAETVNWTGLLTNSTYAPKPGARHCEEWRSFPLFSFFRFYETPKNGVSISLNAV